MNGEGMMAVDSAVGLLNMGAAAGMVPMPADWAVQQVSRIEDWRSLIGDCYFPLSVDQCGSGSEALTGSIANGQLGHLQVSRLRSSPVIYRRERHHFRGDTDQHFLVTLPHMGPVRFSQLGREAICPPSDFVLETSNAPYVFEYNCPNSMTVIKVPADLLADRIPTPEDYCAMRYNGSEGSGALFVSLVRSMIAQAEKLPPDVALRCSEHAIDLLALVLNASTPNRTSFSSSVRRSHLDRVSLYIIRNLADMELSPQMIAEACGLSVRYLHLLFEPTGWTCWQWIRDSRLSQCYNALLDDRNDGKSISELCYRWGFNDQATFTRSFRARFEVTPGDVRRNRGTLSPLRDPRFELIDRTRAD